jgi:hypothetical protein
LKYLTWCILVHQKSNFEKAHIQDKSKLKAHFDKITQIKM